MAEMTSLQRVQAVLAGQMPDRLPVIPQGFLFSAKTAGYDIGAINRSPAKMAESHLLCLEKYGYEGYLTQELEYEAYYGDPAEAERRNWKALSLYFA